MPAKYTNQTKIKKHYFDACLIFSCLSCVSRVKKIVFKQLLRTLSIVLLRLVLMVAAALAQDETIRVETDLVTVNVAVTNKQGKPVKNLRQEKSEIFDNKMKQQIAYFSAETSPVTCGVVYEI